MKNLNTLFWALGMILLAGCHSASRDSLPAELSLADHELVGKIWQVKSKQFVDKQQLLNDALNKEYILLGETHDNPVHHNYQAWVIDQLHARGRKLSVAFEMLNPEQGEALAGQQFQNADQIFDAVKWDETGWPSRKIYKPVFTAALNAGFNIYPANIDRKALNQVIRQGEDNLPENIKAQLKENPLSEKAEDLLRSGIVESHCQMLPEQMVPAMMLGQRVRDAVIANSVMNNKAEDGIVLIAGSGHTLKSGVYGFIRSKDPTAKIFTMAWMEVDKRFSHPEDYRDYWGAEELPFDYVWFTPRMDRPDPCEELKKHHKFSKPE
jgi:uncharacterized iron-regulated protein